MSEDLRKIFSSTDFWMNLFTRPLSKTHPLWGVREEVRFDLLTTGKTIQELAEWYAGLFKTSDVFDPDTGIEEFIGVEKEVKAFLEETKKNEVAKKGGGLALPCICV